jgi:hypothetical protein
MIRSIRKARRLFVVLALVCCSSTATGMTPRELMNEGHVRVRIGTDPARQVVVGQQTRFFVEILTDTWFTSAPAYPELNLEGAIALMPEQFGSNFTERIDGVTYAAQRRSYVLFPQRAGPLEIPSLKVRLAVSGEGKPATPFSLRTPPLRLNVVLPVEMEGVDGVVTTPRLQVKEAWSRPLENLKVGDAIKRTIRTSADQALGMLLPDLEFIAPQGVAVYPDQAIQSDRINRGQYFGERVEHVTYILQRSGVFTLPAIELHWFDPVSGTLASHLLEPITLEVSEADAGLALSSSPEAPATLRERLDRTRSYLEENFLQLILLLLSVVAAAVVFRRAGPGWLEWIRARPLSTDESERRRFRDLKRVLSRGEPGAITREFWRWQDRVALETPFVTTHQRKRAGNESGFTECWSKFERARYAGGSDNDHSDRSGDSWSSADRSRLRRSLREFRNALISAQRRNPSTPRLLWLNPDSSARESI